MKVKSIKTIIIVLSALLLLGASIIEAAQEKATAGKDEKKLELIFNDGKRSVYSKNWLKAMEQFRYIIETYSKSKLVDDSLYWLSYSMKKRSEALENPDEILSIQKQALAHLETLMKQYPSSTWVDDAKLLRVEIAENLVKRGFKEYKKYINRAAEDENLEMKLLALDALLHMDKDKAFPILEKFIRTNKNPKLREKAIFVISQIQDPRVIPLLMEIARSNDHIKIREKAIFWLGQCYGSKKEIIRFFTELYSSIDQIKLKEKIIFSISQQGGDDGVKELIKIFRKEKNLKLKKKIIFWLSQMRSKEAEQFIEKILLE